MKFSLFSSPQTEPVRCAFTKSNGHRCRMFPVDGSTFCPAHIPKPDPLPSSDQLATSDLLQAAGSFSSPEDVHRFLAQVTLQLIQDRISLKKAGLFSYLGQNLLRAQREIAFHQKLKEDADRHEAEESNEPYGTYEIPRPWRGEPGERPPSRESLPDSATGTNSSLSTSSETIATAGIPINAPIDVPSYAPINHAVDPTTPLPAVPIQSASSIKPPSATVAPLNSPAKQTPPAPEPPPPLRDMRHFYPIDPTLHPSVLGPDPSTNMPHPDAAECRRRERLRGIGPRLYGRRY